MKIPGDPRPSRLQKCPCGSGRRYKDCHGHPNRPGDLPYDVDYGPAPAEIVALVREHEAKRRDFEDKHGQVRPIIATEFAGYRLTAVGNRIHYAKLETVKVFPDFLNNYIHSRLGMEWGKGQVARPFAEQHPVVQWRTTWTTRQQSMQRDADGLFIQKGGAGISWWRLAYDLYLLDHHDELQKQLLKRLRDSRAFQGARFEIVAAASMLPAGYELEFENDKLPGKHAEFVARKKGSGTSIAVEAKSRHRSGVLGQPGERTSPERAEILSMLRAALAKDSDEPLLVMIELNMPIIIRDGRPPPELVEELESAWEQVQADEWPKGFPAFGVVFYNDAAPWFLEELPPGGSEVFAISMWPQRHRHAFDEQLLLPTIIRAMYQRLAVPKDFPTRPGSGALP